MGGTDEIAKVLAHIGFTSLEADVYVCLLQHSPATGYKIATLIDRSFPNTYRALKRLQERGAVLVDEGANKVVRAAPLEDLFNQYQSRFHEMRKRAMSAAASLPRMREDTRIYRLETASQVIERSRRMLAEAEERVLVELFPEPAEILRGAVEETAGRGVIVAARVYRPTTLRGVHLVHSPFGEQTLQLMRSQWLAIFVDGRQFLLGHLISGSQAVHQATWSRNPFLAWAFYDYVNSDLLHYSFRERLYKARSLNEAREAYRECEKLFPPGGDPGFQEMLELVNRAKVEPAH